MLLNTSQKHSICKISLTRLACLKYAGDMKNEYNRNHQKAADKYVVDNDNDIVAIVKMHLYTELSTNYCMPCQE